MPVYPLHWFCVLNYTADSSNSFASSSEISSVPSGNSSVSPFRKSSTALSPVLASSGVVPSELTFLSSTSACYCSISALITSSCVCSCCNVSSIVFSFFLFTISLRLSGVSTVFPIRHVLIFSRRVQLVGTASAIYTGYLLA